MITRKYDQNRVFGNLDNNFTGVKKEFNKLVEDNANLKLSERLLTTYNTYSYTPKPSNKNKMLKTMSLYDPSSVLKRASFNLYNYKNIPTGGQFNILKQILTRMENKQKNYHSNSLYNAIHTTCSTQESVYKPKIMIAKPQNTYKSIFSYKDRADKITNSFTHKLIKKDYNNGENNNKKLSYLFQKVKKEELSSTESNNLMVKNLKKFNLDCQESFSPNKKEICGKDYIMINGEKIVAKKMRKLIKVDYCKIKTVEDIEKNILDLSMNSLLKKVKDKMKKKVKKKDNSNNYLPKMYKTNKCVNSSSADSDRF